MNSISANLNVMIKASEKASKGIIRDFGEVEKLQVSVKGPSDYVSNADKKAEKIIIAELEKAKKNFSIISEEIGSKLKNDKDNVWIIDPIDGTSNFLHGIPHFAISIALKSNNEIVSGVIYDPIKDEMFYAEKNNGSYLNNKSIRVSKRKNLDESLFATGGNENLNNNLSTRRSGSAALDMAYVAAGRFDGYFQKNLNLWDVAAGIVIAKEAGAYVNDIDLNKKEKIKVVASNNSISEKLLKNLSNF
tara:strand:- start:5 stop:745 length:741 start_codon:yes stop_codon:yes gene_type:complete